MTDHRSSIPSESVLLVARNLRRLRTQRSFALDDLADRTGVDLSTLNALEAGAIEPPLDLVWKLAKALGVPFAALLRAERLCCARAKRSKSSAAIWA